MKLMYLIPGLLAVGLLALEAAELGRQDVKQPPGFKPPMEYNTPLTKGHRGQTLLRPSGYGGQVIETGPGIEVGLDWNMLWWTLGKTYSDRLYAPQASLLYGVGKNWDIRITGKFLMARDAQEGLNADTDFYRVGVGSRAWFHAGGDWYPFVTVLINYYLFDINTNVKNGSGAEGMPGVSAEAGIAYMVDDWVRVHLAFQGETSILPGSVNYQGNSENVRVYGAGLTLGVFVVF
ncbi:MAG: hypothetical protein L6437_12350 [Kiritimatiellae bacterium]|nr:hypothetical protein [Verrucomicrobiota bacterium]MCG2661022.1 hypothetical protein [Kiritimatiellia bacterium]